MAIQVDTSSRVVAAGGGRPAVLDSAHVGDIHGALGTVRQSDFAPRRSLRARLLTLLAPRLQRGACIAALSSVAGDRGRAKVGIYGASKAGLDAFLSALRQRLQPAGVRVLTLKPGFVDTPMTAALPKTPLFATAAQIGSGIVRAVDAGRDGVVYLPWWWRFIMLVVKALPERVFKRLSF